MASVQLKYRWVAGDHLTVTVEVDNDYPDCLSTAAAQAVRAMREAVTALVGLEAEADPDSAA